MKDLTFVGPIIIASISLPCAEARLSQACVIGFIRIHRSFFRGIVADFQLWQHHQFRADQLCRFYKGILINLNA